MNDKDNFEVIAQDPVSVRVKDLVEYISKIDGVTSSNKLDVSTGLSQEQVLALANHIRTNFSDIGPVSRIDIEHISGWDPETAKSRIQDLDSRVFVSACGGYIDKGVVKQFTSSAKEELAMKRFTDWVNNSFTTSATMPDTCQSTSNIEQQGNSSMIFLRWLEELPSTKFIHSQEGVAARHISEIIETINRTKVEFSGTPLGLRVGDYINSGSEGSVYMLHGLLSIGRSVVKIHRTAEGANCEIANMNRVAACAPELVPTYRELDLGPDLGKVLASKYVDEIKYGFIRWWFQVEDKGLRHEDIVTLKRYFGSLLESVIKTSGQGIDTGVDRKIEDLYFNPDTDHIQAMITDHGLQQVYSSPSGIENILALTQFLRILSLFTGTDEGPMLREATIDILANNNEQALVDLLKQTQSGGQLSWLPAQLTLDGNGKLTNIAELNQLAGQKIESIRQALKVDVDTTS